jgi:hypothetical protein
MRRLPVSIENLKHEVVHLPRPALADLLNMLPRGKHLRHHLLATDPVTCLVVSWQDKVDKEVLVLRPHHNRINLRALHSTKCLSLHLDCSRVLPLHKFHFNQVDILRPRRQMDMVLRVRLQQPHLVLVSLAWAEDQVVQPLLSSINRCHILTQEARRRLATLLQTTAAHSSLV